METKTKKKLFIATGLLVGFILLSKLKKSSSTSVNSLVVSKLSKKYESQNKKFIEELNPAVKKTFINFLNDIEKLGFAYVINNTYRPTSEQIALKKKDSRNATAGFSTHEYGIGLDLSLVKNNTWINKKSSLETNLPFLV